MILSKAKLTSFGKFTILVCVMSYLYFKYCASTVVTGSLLIMDLPFYMEFSKFMDMCIPIKIALRVCIARYCQMSVSLVRRLLMKENTS